MDQQIQKKSLLEMARGAFLERFDYEVPKILENILDENTDPKAKRAITLKMTFIPSDDRLSVRAVMDTNVKLAPTTPIQTYLYVGNNPQTGEMQVVEMVPEVPGQQTMDGGEQESPTVLKIVNK